jgi:hypothetical protein
MTIEIWNIGQGVKYLGLWSNYYLSFNSKANALTLLIRNSVSSI